jgi:hypothetical protein
VRKLSYRVETDSAGRAGNVYYREGECCLTFWWEFTTNGAAIRVPSALAWDRYFAAAAERCAQGRRLEIIKRIAEETRRQQAPKAEIEYEDEWIVFRF